MSRFNNVFALLPLLAVLACDDAAVDGSTELVSADAEVADPADGHVRDISARPRGLVVNGVPRPDRLLAAVSADADTRLYFNPGYNDIVLGQLCYIEGSGGAEFESCWIEALDDGWYMRRVYGPINSWRRYKIYVLRSARRRCRRSSASSRTSRSVAMRDGAAAVRPRARRHPNLHSPAPPNNAALPSPALHQRPRE